MKLIWTASSSPLSQLIRWALKEPVSHFAIVFDDKIVFHSNLLGCHVEWFGTFKKKCTVVYEVEYKLPLEVEESIYQQIISENDKKWYDYRAFAYFAWRALLFMLFKTPFPKVNKWNDGDSFLCTGLISKLPKEHFPGLCNITDSEMTSPYQAYLKLKK